MHQEPDGLLLSEELLLRARRRAAAQIKACRETRELSQRAAARDAGIHQTEWSRIERALVDPRLSSLIRIQHALHLDTLEMLFGALPSRRVLADGDEAAQ
jgi:transcriptional regulator with XRE-family HTH domain